MAWTQDRFTLWNAVEHTSLRRNARLAREWLVTLPSELSPAQRSALARRFAQELADKYRCSVDLCVHLPRPLADARHHHAHLLMTTREISPDGLGRRTHLESKYWERQQRGVTGSAREDYVAIRERGAQVTNEALRAAGHSARVDHRSFAAQGLDREPTLSLPISVVYQERRTGMVSAGGNDIRARHLERVLARVEGPEALARVIERQKGELRERALRDFARRKEEPKRLRASQLTREERNARWREQCAASRQRYQKRVQRDPEKVREQRRQWYQEHAAEISRSRRVYRTAHREDLSQKTRQYRKDHKEEINRKDRERYRRKRAEQSLSKSSPTAEESAQRWKAYRDRNGPGPTAEDSARDWLAYRESHGPGPTADESARSWLAFRERERVAGALESSDPPGHGEDREESSVEADDHERKAARKRDHDFSL